MAKLPNPIHTELNSLHLAVRRLVRATVADSWKGGGDPADIPQIEQDLNNTEETYLHRLRRVNDLLRRTAGVTPTSAPQPTLRHNERLCADCTTENACQNRLDLPRPCWTTSGVRVDAAPSLADAARRVLAASEKATLGCAVPRWAGQENGNGEEFGVALDAALSALRDALGVKGPEHA